MDLVSDQVLEKFVMESNAIEGLPARKGLYHDVHVRAAKAVRDNPNEFLFDLKALHRRFAPVFDYMVVPGEYRHEGAFVGLQKLPHPQHIQLLMIEFGAALVEACRSETFEALTESKRVELAWNMHHWFVCIHPFSDGNGRVGRLLLNGLRQVFGLPWYIVPARQVMEYFNAIKKYETAVFIPAHPDVYSGAT